MTVRNTVSSALQALFSPPSTTRLPISSTNLLTKVISWSLTNHPNIPRESRLRLTDLKPLEDLLVDFSQTWEHGTLQIEYDKSAQLAADVRTAQVTVTDVKVDRPITKKRKRENSAECG